MLFNSLRFMAFFPAVVLVYFAMPHRWRWVFLLSTSYFFYMVWHPAYVLLLLAATLANYAAGLGMAASPTPRARLACFLSGLVASLGMLFFFKYYNFFVGTLDTVFPLFGLDMAIPYSRFLLPVGISFFTFQSLSYAIEVYWRHREPERHLGYFALYVAFFPQLVAGPIERPGNLLPQFREAQVFDYRRVKDGLSLMAWGLFKKVVIADRMAVVVDKVYGDLDIYSGPAITIATLCFGYQIYCDFSGYSDMAVGAAQVFGIRLMENFRRPYAAASIAEYWRRWHISLSSWFRDYVYFPLGGNRVALPRWSLNILIVFLASGLWHGAGWTYVLWSLFHGVCILAERYTAAFWKRLFGGAARLRHALGVVYAFSMVSFGWVLFRPVTLSDSWVAMQRLPTGWGQVLRPSLSFTESCAWLGVYPREFFLLVFLVIFLEAVQALRERGSLRERIARQPFWVRGLVYSAGLWALILFGYFQQKEFIYFVF